MRQSLLVCSILAGACLFAVTAEAEDKKEAPKAEAAAKPATAAPVTDTTTATAPVADTTTAASAPAAGEKKEAPEFLAFDKAKLGAVKFPHKAHADRAGCAACHEGTEPLFVQKLTGGFKMADMYAGKTCGACHNGKETAVGKDKKIVFAAKGSCVKCHKKA